MKLFILSLLTLISAHAFGSPASELCARLTFESDRNQCWQVVRDHFYEAAVVDVCGRQTFASDKINCLGVTADKNYSYSELIVCKAMTFPSEINNCLSNIGRATRRAPTPMPPPMPRGDCPSYRFIKMELNDLHNVLRGGDNYAARARLREIMDRLEACPN